MKLSKSKDPCPLLCGTLRNSRRRTYILRTFGN